MKCKKIHLQTIPSTNAFAKENYLSFDPKLITLITAEEQTEGIGKFNRSWHSPKGENIYATFCFRLPKDTLHSTSISNLLALSLCQILIDLDFTPQVKWPNDIFLNDKKVSGVLCETLFENNETIFFLGIGINVNMEKAELVKIDQPATSLKQERNTHFDIDELVNKLEKRFCKNLATFQKEGFFPFHDPFQNLLLYKGEMVTLETKGTKIQGILHSITVEGMVNLCLKNHEIQSYSSGTLRKL